MKRGAFLAGLVTALGLASAAQAQTTATMNMVNEKGVGQEVGTVTMSESRYGVVFTPKLTGLPPGLHGFHVHDNPSCEVSTKDGKTTPAGAAGGHLDPGKTGHHGAPWGDGHLGDLPALYVDSSGNASQPVLARGSSSLTCSSAR